MSRQPLTRPEIDERMSDLIGWDFDGRKSKDVPLRNFVEAFGFMTKVTLEAESSIIIRSGVMSAIVWT